MKMFASKCVEFMNVSYKQNLYPFVYRHLAVQVDQFKILQVVKYYEHCIVKRYILNPRRIAVGSTVFYTKL